MAPWISAVGVVLGASWTADTIRESLHLWVKGEELVVSFIGISYVLFFLLMLCWLYCSRNAFFQPRTRLLRDVETPERRAHLILFLSELELHTDAYKEGIPEWLTLTGDLDADIAATELQKKRKRLWKWELPLRAIRYHLGTLKTITVICSPESATQVRWFRNVLSRYDGIAKVAVRVLAKKHDGAQLMDCLDDTNEADGWSFESFDDLSHAILQSLKSLKQQGIHEHQVMIDFTGGEKVTSVVAASMTFNRKIKAQHVQTNSPWKVVGYDVVIQL